MLNPIPTILGILCSQAIRHSVRNIIISINYSQFSLLLNTLLKYNIKAKQISQDIDINRQHTIQDPRQVSLQNIGLHTNVFHQVLYFRLVQSLRIAVAFGDRRIRCP